MTRRSWAQLGAYLFVVVLFAFALWQIEQVRLHDKARACVASWERSNQIRNMGEAVYRRNAKTLVGFAGHADPEQVASYLLQVNEDVVEIRAKVHDPPCDLDAAKRRLR